MTDSKILSPKAERSSNLTQRAPFFSIRREMERLFDDLEGGAWSHPFRRDWLEPTVFGRDAKIPAVDVTEKDNAFEITAELPGIDEKDIEVTMSNGGLLIRGEKKAEKDERKKDYYHSERTYGFFERYFALPDSIAAEKISASFKNGVLTVTMPKTAQAQSGDRKIPVKAA